MAKAKEKPEYTGAEEVEVKKEAVNVLDLLLGADIGKIELPTKDFEITRLSELYGAPFIVTCKALSHSKYEELQDMALDVNGKEVEIDTDLLQTFTVMECILDGTGNQLFKNKDVMRKFNAKTPKELVKVLLLNGEVTALYNVIAKLSGFGDDAIKEVKN